MVSWIDWQASWHNLGANKVRTFLAMLGIAIGTASVVALVTVGLLAESTILSRFNALGTNILSVAINLEPSASSKHAPRITGLQVASLVERSPYHLTVAPMAYLQGAPVFKGHTYYGHQVIATSESLFDLAKASVAKGRSMRSWESGDVCVLGHALAATLRKKGLLAPLGSILSLGAHRVCQVVGVLRPWQQNMFVGADLNTSIFVPIDRALQQHPRAQVTNLLVRFAPGGSLPGITEELRRAISGWLGPSVRVFVHSPEQLIQEVQHQQRTMNHLLAVIGAIALLVGGIGIMNIMLVSVLERRKEIGIRLAIGARQRDIRVLFCLESIMLSMLGGTLGVAVGLGVTGTIAFFAHWAWHWYWEPPLLGWSISVLVGIFFGYYPAHQASNMSPIEALHGVV